ILRPESGDFSYPRNPLTKNSDGSRAKTQLDGKTEQQRAEEEKKKAEAEKERKINPFHDQKVYMWFTVHCDHKTTFHGASIPAPKFDIIQTNVNNKDAYQVYLYSIAKGFPIQLRTYEHTNCKHLGLSHDTERHEYDIPFKGVEHIQTNIYKDTVHIKDEDIFNFWVNTGSPDSVNYDQKSYDRASFEIESRWQLNFFDKIQLANPFGKGFDVTGTDLIYSRSRISGNLWFNGLKTRGDKHIFFEYNDKGKIDKNIFENFSLQRYVNESPKSNTFTLKDLKKLSIRDDDSIEGVIYTNSNKSDPNGRTKEQTNPKETNEGFKKEIRRSSLEFYSNEDREKYSYRYNNEDKPSVWIVSHGWCDTRDSFRPIADEIKKHHPQDIVFTFDWSESSFNDCGTCIVTNCP
ncbi:MAG: hypothetical protein ACRCXZ_10625, partial [Patescibacteria group bacterium]